MTVGLARVASYLPEITERINKKPATGSTSTAQTTTAGQQAGVPVVGTTSNQDPAGSPKDGDKSEDGKFVWKAGYTANGQWIPGHWERPRADSAPAPPPPVVRDHTDDEKKAVEGPDGTVILVDKGLTTSNDDGTGIKIDPEKVKAAEEAASKRKETDNRDKYKVGIDNAPKPGAAKPPAKAPVRTAPALNGSMVAVGAALVAYLLMT